MRKPPHRAAAQSQTNPPGAKLVQSSHLSPIYGTGSDAAQQLAAEMGRLFALHRHSDPLFPTASRNIGKNRLTRAIDAVLELIRRRLPPIHRFAVRLLALLLLGYAHAVRLTA